MDMGSKIKQLRKEKGLTLEQLGDMVGVGKSTVRKWENGMIANMKRDKILAVSKALGTTPAYLMGWKGSEKKAVTIKVVGNVAAGIPISAIEDIIDTEEIPEEMASTGEYFGLLIKGDSMSPRILDGDVVIVRKQPDAESGDIVIAKVNGEDACCKKLIKNKEGITLQSLNPNYEPMYFSKKDIMEKPVDIIGKVVELRGKYS